jgi:integrase/recombinase XerD
MGLGKQAKILSKHQQTAMLRYLETTRNPPRNKVIFLLSIKAGLRAKEIAMLTWGMITDSEANICDVIALTDCATKGRSGGIVWMNKDLKLALKQLSGTCAIFDAEARVINTERARGTSPQVIVNLFADWYRKMGFNGCSSHSGRRTFIANAAKKISSVGGSMRDVQMLARHRSLNMTMLYVEADKEAMRKVVELV